MDNLKSAAQAFAALSFKGRCPSWKEYENGSPAEQRAIIERWAKLAIYYQPDMSEFVVDDQFKMAANARALLNSIEKRKYAAIDQGAQRKEFEQKLASERTDQYLQWDYERSGISGLTKGELGS